jgi:hypothetical protein
MLFVMLKHRLEVKLRYFGYSKITVYNSQKAAKQTLASIKQN